MKILILTSHYPPISHSGHSIRCQQVAEALSLRGHRLQVLTSNHRVPPGGIKSDRGVYRELVLHADFTDEELSELDYQDVLTLDLKNVGIVDDRIERFKPDIALVWDCSQLSKSLLMCLSQADVAVAFDLYSDWLREEYFAKDPWRWWWKHNSSVRSRTKKIKMLLSGGARRIQKKLPIYDRSKLNFSLSWLASESLRKTYTNDGVESLQELPVVHSAMKVEGIAAKRTYAKTGRFMWAGRLSEGKAPGLALEAIAKLNADGEDVSLDVFGMGEQAERKLFRERLNEMKLEHCVKIITIAPGQMKQHYANYDACLFTSICDDPFPMTPFEAMAAGLPCILSQDGGIPEIVTQGESALIFKRGDVQAMVDAMRSFLSLPDAGAKIASEAKRIVTEKYSFENYLDQLDELVFSKMATKGI